MTSPIPLRERLQAALYDESGREALRVFRDWLRDQAATVHANSFDLPAGATHIFARHTADYLQDVLADAIDKELNQ